MEEVYFYGGINTYRVKVLNKSEFFGALNGITNISENEFREFLSDCEKKEMIKMKPSKATLIYLGAHVVAK